MRQTLFPHLIRLNLSCLYYNPNSFFGRNHSTECFLKLTPYRHLNNHYFSETRLNRNRVTPKKCKFLQLCEHQIGVQLTLLSCIFTPKWCKYDHSDLCLINSGIDYMLTCERTLKESVSMKTLLCLFRKSMKHNVSKLFVLKSFLV